MKLTKFDIGAEIISILTKGMYPNPYDAVREYIQNAIDAKSKDVQVKVRNNTLVIQDNGSGMNIDILRKAVRVGVSDKKPGKDVGFMGIGIYSAFHLCDKLEILSHGSDGLPNKLTMNFGTMKALLEQQKQQRLNSEISGDELLDLQSILEDHIEITDNGDIHVNEFPSRGTRIKLSNIDSFFYTELVKFDDLADYLSQVVPLHFDREKFTWAKEIETEIAQICNSHNAHFEIINLSLQINARTETLYRPYKDSDFHKKGIIPLKPIFYEIKDSDTFWGVAWGCLNDDRKVVETRNIRGFVMKKQGFSIGTRESLVKHFLKGHTIFDRYVGEIIVTNDKLLPNASRNDFEFSVLRTHFIKALIEVTSKFDKIGEDYQQWTKGDEEITKNIKLLKEINAEFNKAIDAEKLVDLISDVKSLANILNRRIKRRDFCPPEKEYLVTEQNVKKLFKQVQELERAIQDKINSLINQKKQTQADRDKSVKIAQNISRIISLPEFEEKEYSSLLELLEDLDIIPTEQLTIVLEAIDESYIQSIAENRKMYFKLLNDLKTDIQQRLEFI